MLDMLGIYILDLVSASDHNSLYKLNTLEEPALDTHYTILMKEKESRLELQETPFFLKMRIWQCGDALLS